MIPSVRPTVAPQRPVAARAIAVATPTKPVQAPQPKLPVKAQAEPQDWTVGRALKTAGAAVGGFAAGGAVTWIADLLFHFGNNGGTALPGGIYLAAAGAVALGAAALYARASAN